jgi:hypothetical protein
MGTGQGGCEDVLARPRCNDRSKRGKRLVVGERSQLPENHEMHKIVAEIKNAVINITITKTNHGSV